MPIVVAHRGLHDEHPENSLEAFRSAVRAGIEWIELDVHATRDGFPAVIHDETLERTTAARGEVRARFADDLRRVRLLDIRAARRAGRSFVPVLRAVAGSGGWRALNASLLIELKTPNHIRLVQRVSQALRTHPRPWAIQSFDRKNLRHAAVYARGIARILLIDSPHELRSALASTRYPLNIRHDLISRALVERMREQGRDIGAWTVNDVADLRRAVKLGLDMIITDRPIEAIRILEDLSPAETATR
jgi:glycerophosphoryl diester phosphodiesterase